MSNIFWKIWLLWLSVASTVWLADAYGSGAPDTACGNMMPGHGISEPKPSVPPYVVEVNPPEYTPGAVITVTIKGITDSKVFQGFLVQARRADPDLDTNQLLGSFTVIPAKAKFAACGGNNALTHIDTSDKGLLSFTWTAPASAVGHVVIIATIAQSKDVFWVNVRSPVIRDTTAPNITTTVAPPTTSSVPQPAVNITPSAPIVLLNPDTQCGNEFGCMRQCGREGCKFVIAWKPLGNGRISFLIQARAPAYDYYIAVGISADSEMGQDTVLDCIKYGGVLKVQQSYNAGRENHVYPEPMEGMTLLNTSIVGDIMICTFEHSIDTYKDLRKPWNLLVAHGGVDEFGIKKFHSDTRVSLTRVLLTNVTYDNVEEWEYTGEGPIGSGRDDSSEDSPTTDNTDILKPPTGHANSGHVCIQTVASLLLLAVLLV